MIPFHNGVQNTVPFSMRMLWSKKCSFLAIKTQGACDLLTLQANGGLRNSPAKPPQRIWEMTVSQMCQDTNSRTSHYALQQQSRENPILGHT